MFDSIRWLLPFLFVPTVAIGGGMDSGGGGLRGFESNPWFIGARDVTYCVEVNPDFPDASTGGVRNTVKNAFREWRRFQDLYRLDERAFNLRFPDNQPRGIDLNYVAVDRCEGADLRVLIGVVDDAVRQVLKKYPPKTYAFAHLMTEYDFKGYTEANKGLVWIAQPELYSGQLFPPYDKRPILPVVLLHEIGHTLGIGHLDKYSIMGGDIFEWMSVAEDDETLRAALQKFVHVDNPTPLVSFGRVTKWAAADAEQRQVAPLFKELLDRDPAGNIEFAIVTIPSDDVRSLDQKGMILLRDDKGSYQYDVQFHVGSENSWPYCKMKLSWKGVAPAEPRDIRAHGCLDSMSSEYLVGSVLDGSGNPIGSKVTIGTRQKVLNSFGGVIGKTQFNIHLKLVGAID